MTPEEEIQRLKDENASLRVRLRESEGSVLSTLAILGPDTAKAAAWFLGSDFNQSRQAVVAQLQAEPHRVPVPEIVDLALAGFARFVKVGAFALLAAIIPSLLLLVQTTLLYLQNSKIETQNALIVGQNHLARKQALAALAQEQRAFASLIETSGRMNMTCSVRRRDCSVFAKSFHECAASMSADLMGSCVRIPRGLAKAEVREEAQAAEGVCGAAHFMVPKYIRKVSVADLDPRLRDLVVGCERIQAVCPKCDARQNFLLERENALEGEWRELMTASADAAQQDDED